MTPRLLTADEIADIERFQVQRRKSPVPQDGWLYVAEIDRLLGHIYAAAAPVPAEQRELAEKMAGRIVDLIAEDADQPEAILLYHKQVTNIIVKELASAPQGDGEDLKEAARIATWLANTFYADQEFILLDTLSGILSQIDNMSVGIYERGIEALRSHQDEAAIRRAAFDEAIAIVQRQRERSSAPMGFGKPFGIGRAKRDIIAALTAARDTTPTDEEG